MAAVAVAGTRPEDRAGYRLIDAQEAAVMLGVNERTIRKLTAAGKLIACVTSTRRRAYRMEDIVKLREGR